VIGRLGAIAVLSYLLGSIPSGFLLARLKRVDVRQIGSGNIGATNVARSAGRTLGLLTLLFDVAKGAIPVLVVGGIDWELSAGADFALRARIVAALAVLIGHCFPITLGFKGGKGVATALGALLALAPAALPLPLLLFAGLFALFRRVSLASLGAAIATPISASLAGYDSALALAAAAMAVLIIYRHRENIGRLLAGTEPRFGKHSDSSRG
jgi:acyl phosphate:glycerol-3-phosphate acyltransferase